MLLTENMFRNGTEVDITNNFHENPNLTLIKSIAGNYIIKSYKTNSVYCRFQTLAEAIDYCNNNFDTCFNTVYHQNWF
jgi:hypothetical protein